MLTHIPICNNHTSGTSGPIRTCVPVLPIACTRPHVHTTSPTKQTVTKMIDEYFSLPMVEFCRRAGIGTTLCRQLIADGTLRAVRVGPKKLLIDVASWREYLRRQGMEPYNTRPAIEARKAKQQVVNLKELELE